MSNLIQSNESRQSRETQTQLCQVWALKLYNSQKVKFSSDFSDIHKSFEEETTI